jgi:hypothetical protein
MATTTILDQWAVLKNRAAGYALRNGQVVNIRRVAQVELPSHYGVFSSVKDLVKWESGLTTGKIVKESSLEQMWTPVKLATSGSFPYGFGWEIAESHGHRMITHNGITGTEYTRFPDDELTAIVLTNLGLSIGGTIVNRRLAQGVAGRFIPDLLLSSLKEQPESNPRLTENLRNFLTNIAKGENAPLMTAGLRAVLSPGVGAVIARRLKDLTSFTFLGCDEIKGRVVERFDAQISPTCYYKNVAGSETRYYTFSLTPEEKVADFASFAE